MISSFTVENYRSFPDKTTIELRPLTLVFGYNNSGKSALLRFLPLIAESVSPSATAPLSLGGKAARGSLFKDLLSRLTSKPVLAFQLQMEETRRQQAATIDFQIRDLPDRRRQIIEALQVKDPVLDFTALWAAETEENKIKRYDIKTRFQEQDYLENAVIEFSGLVPKTPTPNTGGPEVSPQASIWFGKMLEPLRGIETGLQWLTSFRAAPKRSNQYRGQSPSRLTPEGENAAEILAYDKLNRGPLLASVSQWYETHTNQTLDVSEEADLFSVTLGPTKNPLVRVNIADTGEGMAQVLPVLVATALARYKENNLSLLVLEQPELHLHPKVHGALAAHFCDLANIDQPPKLLVETHSENFLLEVQLQIAKGLISPDKVLVYWVRQDEEGRSSVERVTFDEMARPQGNWPPEVFREDIEKSREIILERRKREGL